MVSELTTIQISKMTRDQLRQLGSAGETRPGDSHDRSHVLAALLLRELELPAAFTGGLHAVRALRFPHLRDPGRDRVERLPRAGGVHRTERRVIAVQELLCLAQCGEQLRVAGFHGLPLGNEKWAPGNITPAWAPVTPGTSVNS